MRELNGWCAAFVLLMWLLVVIAWLADHGVLSAIARHERERIKWFRGLVTWRKFAVLFALWFVVADGADKSAGAIPILRMMFFDPIVGALMPSGVAAPRVATSAMEHKLAQAQADVAAAATAAVSATNTAAQIGTLRTNALACTLDVDWHAPTRVPAAVNIMAWQVWVTPTNIAGVMHEDHFIRFSSVPSQAPGMVFDYYDLAGERYQAQASTNSFPALYGIALPSGVHSCYWFRCEVPARFTQRLRTWDGEVRFGGPRGSAFGFDLAGILLIDNGNAIWKGLTTNIVHNGELLEHINGICVSSRSLLSSEAPAEDAPLMSPLRSLLGARETRKVTHDRNRITVTTGKKKTEYPLGFSNNRKAKK